MENPNCVSVIKRMSGGNMNALDGKIICAAFYIIHAIYCHETSKLRANDVSRYLSK